MPIGDLHKWVSDSYKEATKSLTNMKELFERKMIGLVTAGRFEMQEAMNAANRVRSHIVNLKNEIEKKVVRKFEAVMDILGIPSESEINELKKRVERLHKRVKDLNNNSMQAPEG